MAWSDTQYNHFLGNCYVGFYKYRHLAHDKDQILENSSLQRYIQKNKSQFDHHLNIMGNNEKAVSLTNKIINLTLELSMVQFCEVKDIP